MVTVSVCRKSFFHRVCWRKPMIEKAFRDEFIRAKHPRLQQLHLEKGEECSPAGIPKFCHLQWQTTATTCKVTHIYLRCTSLTYSIYKLDRHVVIRSLATFFGATVSYHVHSSQVERHGKSWL